MKQSEGGPVTPKFNLRRSEGELVPPKLNPRRSEGGFSLVEVMIALCVIVFSLVGLVASILYTSKSNALIRENEAAARASQDMFERMRTYPVGEIFARFNTNTGDDPGITVMSGVTWTATKVTFRVPQFDPTGVTDLDGDSGEITFPGNGTTLAESNDPSEPLLNDLDADGNTGESDVSANYSLLPITITVTWKGISGQRTLTYRQILLNSGFTYPGP